MKNLEGLAEASRAGLDANLARTVEQSFEDLALVTEAHAICKSHLSPTDIGLVNYRQSTADVIGVNLQILIDRPSAFLIPKISPGLLSRIT